MGATWERKVEELMADAERRARNGRLERLRVLLSEQDEDPTPISGIAYEYLEEARLCWYVGAFVATITMSQMAFEEVLRSHYRVVKGVDGDLRGNKKLDQAGFADLVDKASEDGWLLPEEANRLDQLRKYRNPWVHPKDVAKRQDGTGIGLDVRRGDFFMQHIKLVAPDLVGEGAEDEARRAVTTLVTMLPIISRRLWGFELTGDEVGESAE